MAKSLPTVPPGQLPSTTHLEFDFVIAERPRYIPGSGPPLEPITIMPPNDKDGYIVEEAEVFGKLCYIVKYDDDSNLQVAVKLPNILEWVSRRALDDYHTNEYDTAVQEEEERELPRLQAKEEARKKRDKKMARLELAVETNSRKRKRSTLVSTPVKAMKKLTSRQGEKGASGRLRGPGSRNMPVEQVVTFKSPKQSQHSQQQPSLSAPGGGLANRTVLDTDTEDEDTEMAVGFQLNGGRIPESNLQSSRSNSPPANFKRTFRSRSTSKLVDTSREESRSPPAPILPPKRAHNPPSLLPSKGAVATMSSRQAPILPPKRTQNPPSLLPSKGAVATMSSRQALKDLEGLERKNENKPLTIFEKYSHTKQKIPPGTFKGAHAHLPPSQGLAQVDPEEEDFDEPEPEEEAADEELEYEVDQILAHEIRFHDGRPDIWYKIQWVGEWDDTWEPEENVSYGAIEDYKARVNDTKRFRGGDGNDSDPDSLFVSDVKGKGRALQPGQVVDDDGVDDDEWQAFGVSA